MTAFSESDYLFVARYKPAAPRVFARRAWVAAAFWVLLGAFLWALPVVNDDVGPRLAVVAVVSPFVAWMVSLALRASAQWGTDDGLAIAIGGRGVALPGVGEIPWDEIRGVEIYDVGQTTANYAAYVAQVWLGILRNANLTVLTHRTLDDMTKVPPAARRGMVLQGDAGGTARAGFRTALREGMDEQVWTQASAILVREAESRGIPVSRHGRDAQV